MSDDEAHAIYKAIRFAENGGEPFCPHCGGCKVYEIKTRRIYKCAACRKQFSMTSGTTFNSLKVTIRDLLYAMMVFVNGVSGVSALRLRREVGFSYKTAFVFCQKLREAMKESRDPRPLRGQVEVDGLCVSPQVRPPVLKKPGKEEAELLEKRNREAKTRQQFVVAVRERGLKGETRIKIVRTSEARGVDFVLDTVEPESTFFTDEGPWSEFDTHGDRHVVKHSIGFKQKGVATNQIESFFARVRRNARGVHYRVLGENLDLYVEEVAWREDHRKLSNGDQWRLLLAAGSQQPVSRRWKGYWQRWQLDGAPRRDRRRKAHWRVSYGLLSPRGISDHRIGESSERRSHPNST